MSTLSNNLQQIYTIKNQIKEVIGTSSDVFSQYPNLISAAIANAEETIAEKNTAWQTKWATALSTMAAGLYAQDSSYGEPQISSPSGWCIQTAIDGDAAMSEMIAMNCLWSEIYGGSSMLHSQYVQIFTQMGLTIDSNGRLVSTDDDKLIPFDADEAVVSNWRGVAGAGTMGGKKISSLNGGIENAKWDYYGVVFNGTGFDYVYLGQFDYVVNQGAMVDKMSDDGVTFINNIPAVNQTTLLNYLTAFQIDEYTPYQSMNITGNGTYDVTSYAVAYVAVPTGSATGTLFAMTPGQYNVASYAYVAVCKDYTEDYGGLLNETTVGSYVGMNPAQTADGSESIGTVDAAFASEVSTSFGVNLTPYIGSNYVMFSDFFDAQENGYGIFIDTNAAFTAAGYPTQTPSGDPLDFYMVGQVAWKDDSPSVGDVSSIVIGQASNVGGNS